jgi:Domain of unknown function (DUF5618)
VKTAATVKSRVPKPNTKAEYLAEARRKLQNARAILKEQPLVDGHFYADPKYVQTACGIGYLGALEALDAVIAPPSGKNKAESIEAYYAGIQQLNSQQRQLYNELHTAYELLHIGGYYRKLNHAPSIKNGFDSIKRIIEIVETLPPRVGLAG